jgi:hypothetical protein
MTMYPFDTTISGTIIDTVTTVDPRDKVQFALFLHITGSTTAGNMIMAGNGSFSIPASSHFSSYRITTGRQRNYRGDNFILDPQTVDNIVPGTGGIVFNVKRLQL